MAERKQVVQLWKPDEDSALISLIQKYGLKNWKIISLEINKKLRISRTSKQCRDRWFNNLTNNKNTEPFTENEINSLFELYSQFGAQWAKISKLIPARTENQLKNFMNATVRRNIRKFNKGKLEHEKIKVNSLEVLNIPEVRAILLMNKNVSKRWFSDKFLSIEAITALDFLVAGKNPNNFVWNQNMEALTFISDYFSFQAYNLFEHYNQYEFYK